MSERPDGSQATTFGWVLIIVGLLAAFVAGTAETFDAMVWAAVSANLAIGLGVILVSLGYLVRAIWFLPGREIKDVPEPVEKEADGTFCDWCHLWVPGPARPCSSSDDKVIRADVDALSGGQGLEEACRYELTKRGYIQE
ncbi:hypothetical protein [Pontixanthobacter sp.]|uniref:hypothetical protein n=1 Tax=Pontixanthobacter sp. TaxID=2792078 RepID=UPI003C7ED98C